MRGFAVLAVAALFTITIPPASAGHGGPYSVEGTACMDEPVGCFDAHLFAQNGVLTGTFRLTFTDPDTGASLPPLNIHGREEYRNLMFVQPHEPCGLLERFDYVGFDTPTEGELFEITGALSLCVGGDHAYHGTLRGHFLTFELVLPFAFPNPD